MPCDCGIYRLLFYGGKLSTVACVSYFVEKRESESTTKTATLKQHIIGNTTGHN